MQNLPKNTGPMHSAQCVLTYLNVFALSTTITMGRGWVIGLMCQMPKIYIIIIARIKHEKS